MSNLGRLCVCGILFNLMLSPAYAEQKHSNDSTSNTAVAKSKASDQTPLTGNLTARCSRLVPITIPEKDFPYSATVQGKILKGVAKIYYYNGGFSGGRNIRMDFTFKNPTEMTAFYSISIGFFDKDGDLVVSEGRYEVFGQEPGKNGHCELEMCLPPGYLPTITDYQLTFYDAAKKIGT